MDKKDHPEYLIKQWCVDAAILKNKKGASIKHVIDDARKIYEFTNPCECELIVLENKSKSK